ncbi:hypothetical protein GCM10010401_08610 [Rarobacter faecitabidus]|uniref:Uncharacterized protein n=1 Tax=Rarobacter faecitabidus TaxID=13243 RepID=A0A542ZAW1_RARFA|nr:hypothetical protein [Rarobacter faecitabidus]TQL57462.1 hypothetical protein FB461_2199 [Rarobacter faecitabidus]
MARQPIPISWRETPDAEATGVLGSAEYVGAAWETAIAAVAIANEAADRAAAARQVVHRQAAAVLIADGASLREAADVLDLDRNAVRRRQAPAVVESAPAGTAILVRDIWDQAPEGEA